ncbi:hypothetical protein ROJ8625_00510 [Roseivivax jejudonensis]|uniref:Transmembrane protein n=1 Tax=Roseivivax jejudonensis TaxID=1529041 RepID=A0A1X6YB73_9RHOB|nr:hypothetical protein [Roseivivax jejudonensis]SLN15688.1 hypothetical protein ROJ8625_00510 [Roseivivax jejudonensis]
MSLRSLRAIAGTLALAIVIAFWTATVVVETLGESTAIVAVKTAIPWALALLVPALIAARATGQALARGRGGALVAAKRRRMSIVAVNGLAILVPAALYLSHKARAGEFDALFYAVQAAELAAGAINIALLGLAFRDGLRLGGRLRTDPAASPASRP